MTTEIIAMTDLEFPHLEAASWFRYCKLNTFLFLFAELPIIFGSPLSGLDVLVVGLGLPFIYYSYLKYKELK